MLFELRNKHFRQFANAGLVLGIADVDNLTIAYVALVFDYPEQALNAFGYIRKASLLVAAVNQLDGRAFDEIENELGYGPRAPNPRRI